MQAALLSNPLDCESWTTLTSLPVTRGDTLSLRIASTLARLALSSGSIAAHPACSLETTAHALTVRPRALVRSTGKLRDEHRALMLAAWRKAVAFDGSAGSRAPSFHYRHAVVRGHASLASELCDWSNYDDAAKVIEWALQLQRAQGGEGLFANVTVKSVVAHGAVMARAMDVGLSLWKEIVGPLQTAGGGEDKNLEIKGRCLLLHKLQFAAECVAVDRAPFHHTSSPHPPSITTSSPYSPPIFAPDTKTPTPCG